MLSVDELIVQKKFLLHQGTGIIGRAKKLYKPGEHKGLNGEPVDAPVMELETGDAFVVTEDAFIILTETETGVYELVTKLLTSTLEIVARAAKAQRVPLPTYALIATSAIQLQARVLNQAVADMAAKEKANGAGEGGNGTQRNVGAASVVQRGDAGVEAGSGGLAPAVGGSAEGGGGSDQGAPGAQDTSSDS